VKPSFPFRTLTEFSFLEYQYFDIPARDDHVHSEYSFGLVSKYPKILGFEYDYGILVGAHLLVVFMIPGLWIMRIPGFNSYFLVSGKSQASDKLSYLEKNILD